MKSKRFFVFSLSLLLLTTIHAALQEGKTYRIVPVNDTGKSLFVQNASFSDKTPVVMWTETNVPAQQWRVKSIMSGNRISLQNVYTGKYLHTSSNKAIQSTSAGYWTISAKDKDANTYTLSYLTSSLYNDTANEDGKQVGLISKSKAEATPELATWQFVEVDEQPSFTTAMRDDMAEAFLDHYLQNKGLALRTFINGGWGECETMEAVLDMYEQTGDNKYWNTYNYCYRYFKQKVGDKWTGGTLNGGYDWYGYDFNDDVMWQIIGASRAACLTGKEEYLADAKRNFDAVWDRANLGYVQLLRWAESTGNRNGTNSCINGPAEVAACYIGIAAADESYFEKARTLYDNQRKYLFDPNTGHVDDAVVLDPTTGNVVSRNTWASTYNQGTMLGAATLLYQHYKDEQYKQDAQRIINFAMQNLCNEQGLISVCQNADGDFQGFKGILMRYAGLYANTFDDQKVKDWLIKNAFHAYNNTNSHHYGHSAWLTKAGENGKFGDVDYTTQAFGASTALRAAFAVAIPSEADGIHSTKQEKRTALHSQHVYSLDGQLVASSPSKMKKGLYIYGGRKVIK